MRFFQWLRKDEILSENIVDEIEYLKIVFAESDFCHFSDVTLQRRSPYPYTNPGLFSISKEELEDPDWFDFLCFAFDNPRAIIIKSNDLETFQEMGYTPDEVKKDGLELEKFVRKNMGHLGKITVIRPNIIDTEIHIAIKDGLEFFPRDKNE